MNPSRSRTIALALVLGLAACASEPEVAAVGEGDAVTDVPTYVATDPLTEVRILRERLRSMDEDGDGFVDRQEAESFWLWRFDKLDDNGDGRLSAAELQLEHPGVPDTDIAHDSLVGVTRESYFEIVERGFEERADPSTGMMSTADFEDMVRNTDPAVTREGRPMIGPEPLE